MSRWIDIRWFKITALCLVLAEVASLWAYTLPWFHWLVIPLIVVGVIWLLRRNYQWALYLPIIELTWGSLGKSFYWDIGSLEVSVRLLLFVIIVVYTFPKIFQTIRRLPLHQSSVRWYLALLFFIFLAVVIGKTHHNSLTSLFLDANAYLYLGYWLIWFPLIPHIDWKKVGAIAIASTLVVSLKTLTIFHIFAHAYNWANITYLYLWIRDTKVGELTFVTGNVWRIFFQSQIYIMLLWLISSILLITEKKLHLSWRQYAVIIVLGSALLNSLSRSFGLALLSTLIITFAALMLSKKILWSRLLTVVICFLGSIMLVAALLFIPPVNADVARAFAQRLSAGEAAASSRQNLLPVLMSGVKQHWLLGAGFGTTLTYVNKDPRIKNFLNPDGSYSTYAFELGWLDFAFKFGILGWLVWASLIVYLLYQGWKRGLARNKLPLLAATAGLLCLSITHALTPYLNHPLGLGYLILFWLYLHHEQTQSSH